MIPEIEKQQLKRLESCLTTYQVIQKNFVRDVEEGRNEAPVIEQEISIDKREIRPN